MASGSILKKGQNLETLLFHMKASASPLLKQRTSLCLSDPSLFAWSPPCNTNSCNYGILWDFLQGKNTTHLVSRLTSCSVFGTIHKTCSELQVEEEAANQQTAAAVQWVSVQLQGKFKVPITHSESKRGFSTSVFQCELVVVGLVFSD